MPHEQITLRLTPEAGEALEAAHAAVGRVIPLHRLAVLALARGSREFARSPALLFGATPPIEGGAPRRGSNPEASGASGGLAQLAADLDALGGGATLRAVVTSAGVHLPTVYAWLKSMRSNGTGRLSDESAAKLRGALNNAAKGK